MILLQQIFPKVACVTLAMIWGMLLEHLALGAAKVHSVILCSASLLVSKW